MRDLMACLRKATALDAWFSVTEEQALAGESFKVEVDLTGPRGAMAAGIEVPGYDDVRLKPLEEGGHRVTLGGWADGSRVDAGVTVPGAFGEIPLEEQVGLMLMAFEAGISPDSPDRLSLRAISRAASERDKPESAVTYEKTMGLKPETGTVLWDPGLEGILGPAAFEEAFKRLVADTERCGAGEEMLFEDTVRPFDANEPYTSIAQYSDCASLIALSRLTGLFPRRAKLVDLGGELFVKGLSGENLKVSLVPEGTSAITDLDARWEVLAEEGRDPDLAHWLGVGPGSRGRDEGDREIERPRHMPLSQQCANARAACERDEESYVGSIPGDWPDLDDLDIDGRD